MIETDSYLYIANNDRDDAGSDEHNSKHIHPHFTGNNKGLYATMIGGRIDPSSCLDTCWVDDMGVGSGFEILTFPETFLPFSLHFQNKSLSLQST